MVRFLVILALGTAGCQRPLSDCEGSRTIDSPREMLRFSRERCGSLSGELRFVPRAGDEGGVEVVFEDLETVGSLTLAPEEAFWDRLTVTFPELTRVERELTIADMPEAWMVYAFPALASVGTLTGPQMVSYLDFPELEEAGELRGVFETLELPALHSVDQVALEVGWLRLPLLEQAGDIALETPEPVELPQLRAVRTVTARTPGLQLRELESLEVLNVNTVEAGVLTAVDRLELTLDGGAVALGSLRTAPSVELDFELLVPVTLPSWTGGEVRLVGPALADLYAPAMTAGSVVATTEVNRLRLPNLEHAPLIEVAMRGPINLSALATADVLEISNSSYAIPLPALESVSERLSLQTSGAHDLELPALVAVPTLSAVTTTSVHAPLLATVADLTATAGESGTLSFPALAGPVVVELTGAGMIELGSTAGVTSAVIQGGTWTEAVFPWASVVDVVELRDTSAHGVNLSGITGLGTLELEGNTLLTAVSAADLQTADRVSLTGDALLSVDAPVLTTIAVELTLDAASLDGCDAQSLIAAAESGGATVVAPTPDCPVARVP